MLKTTSRLEFLDFLRFIAAFSVLIQHTLESKFPSFTYFCTYYFQFGVFGVTLFFLTSGFIIPVSLEKYQSLKAFWISRIFRLFPLYIVSILASIFFIYLGWIEGILPEPLAFVANLIMMAKFLGQPLIQGLYWTLNLEMLFYMIISGLFFIGLLKRSVLIAYAALLSAFLLGVVGSQVLHLFRNGWGLCFYLATMFVGTVYYRYMKQQISAIDWIKVITGAFLVLFSITYFNLYNQDKPEDLGTRSFWPFTNAFLFAYLLFTICFLYRKISFPKPLLYLGLISYSIYLVQATVLFLVLPRVNNAFISSVLCITITLLVSYFTYRFIEKPFIKLGKKLGRSKTLPLPA